MHLASKTPRDKPMARQKRGWLAILALLAIFTGLLFGTFWPFQDSAEEKACHEYFEMGQYYRKHLYENGAYVIRVAKAETDERERAVCFVSLLMPEDKAHKERLQRLLLNAFQSEVKVRNRYVDAFIKGFESK